MVCSQLGTPDAQVSLQQVAQAAQQPQFGGRTLAKTLRYNRGGGFTFPNGAHIAEVEIDPDTGVVEVVRYTAVDDCGRVINPLLAAGQVHGGVAMGIGQGLAGKCDIRRRGPVTQRQSDGLRHAEGNPYQ